MASERRRGDRRRPERPEDEVTPEMMIVGATLGILMTVLAFSLI